MDLNHDYTGLNDFLVIGSVERLQLCKCIILSQGDLGYTDPPIMDIRTFIGDYTDTDSIDALRRGIYNLLVTSQAVMPEEIISIDVVSSTGSDKFIVDMQFSFGSGQVVL